MVCESNAGGDEIFHISPDQPWGYPRLLYNGLQDVCGGYSGRGVTLSNPHLSLRLKKEYSYTSWSSWPVLGQIFLYPHNFGQQDFSLPLCVYVSVFKPIDRSVRLCTF